MWGSLASQFHFFDTCFKLYVLFSNNPLCALFAPSGNVGSYLTTPCCGRVPLHSLFRAFNNRLVSKFALKVLNFLLVVDFLMGLCS
jgi:hypothetical protein